MDCLFPPALSDGQLWAYVEGEATPDITEHIAHCPPCQQRAATLARQQRRLAAALYRAACPSSLALGEYQLRLLAPDQMQTIQIHLQSCPHCNRELAELTRFLADEPALPQAEAGPGWLEGARVLIARLINNLDLTSAPTPALVGIRGELEEQQIYEADEVQIVLEVQADVQQIDRKVILGLVLGLDEPQTMSVLLWQGEQAIAQTTADELGNFVLSNLASGQYHLFLRGTGLEIRIPNLSV